MEKTEIKAVIQVNSIELPRSNTEDTVDNVFKIHLNEEVLELSNEFCKYYQATNAEDQTMCFAIIYHNYSPKLTDLDFLSKNITNGLNQLLAYSVVRLSSTNAEHLVAIVSGYNPEETLEKYIESGKTLTIKQIDGIITKVADLLDKLQAARIFGFTINSSNILMKDGEFFAIREFITSYSNFYQEEAYLAPELAECHQAARYIASINSDIYSLGISLIYGYSGKALWEEHKDIADYNFARFENTTSKYLVSRIKFPERVRALFKWILHDEASMRWKVPQLQEWAKGTATKATHESLSEKNNALGFKGNNYSTFKSISYALFNHWNAAITFTKDNKILKWVGREQIDNDSLEAIKVIFDSNQDTSFVATNNINSNMRVAKLLAVLDPNGPIRQESLAVSAASIPYFFQYLVSTNKKSIAENLLKIMKDEDWQLYYDSEDASGHLDRISADLFKNLASRVQSNSPTLGIDRLVYSLNPNSPCTSKMLKGMYITSIPELLTGLDNAAEKNPKKFNIDKQIVSFVAAKLDLKEDIKSTILPNFPKFSEHPVIRGLSILSVLQQHEPDIEIPNLCKVIVSDLIELFKDHLHNVEFKKKIILSLEGVAKEGDLVQIIHILSDQQKFINDYNGYYEACRRSKVIEEKIRIFDNESITYNGSLMLGQKMTVLVSYVLCFIVTITVIL